MRVPLEQRGTRVDKSLESRLARCLARVLGLLPVWLFVGLLLLAPKPAPLPSLLLDRQQAETLNYYAAPFCDLEAHAGDELHDVLIRLRRCADRPLP